MPDIAMHNDVDPLHGNATARRGIALDDKQSPPPGGAGILTGITLNDDGARHHVLGNARADRSLDKDIRLLVHAAAIIAG